MISICSKYCIKSRGPRFFGLLIICCLMITVLILPAIVQADMSEKDATEVLSRFGEAMAKVAEKVKPSVVNISTSRTVKTQRLPFFDDPFFRRFFGEDFHAPQKRRVTNLGSGVIATSDGYILTNNHVIEGAEDILVKLPNGKEYKGRVIGMDTRTDIAVIKIDEIGLTAIPWGDSDKLKVGEVVLAIGNPFGLNQTTTMGIISALGRSGIGITDYEDFIQTDAAINPGNSGGALTNIKGELIGVNTAIFSTTGGYQGIGFAIPSNMARNVMESILNQGRVVRGFLGVTIQELTQELAKQFNIKDEKGVLLVDIAEGGPAEKGGLKIGDIIIEYDGKRIENTQQFRNIVAATKPGKTAKIKIVREGKPETVIVTIGELPIEPQVVSAAQFDNVLKGVFVTELTDEYRQKYNIPKRVSGVVVNNIDEESPALGILRNGDIIMEINRKAVLNTKEYNEIVSKIAKNQDVLLRIARGNSILFITLTSR